MPAETVYDELDNRHRQIQEKFDMVFGSEDVTIDMHIHDQLLEVTVSMKHMESMKNRGETNSELYEMTADIVKRKLTVLDRYVNKMISSDINNG